MKGTACRSVPRVPSNDHVYIERPLDAGVGGINIAFEDLLVVVQVENAKAIDAIPEIAAVEGIDVIFIGPRDLSATLGKLNQFDDPEVRGQIDRAAAAILKSGKILGSTATSGKAARAMADKGFRFIIPGSDVTLLGLGVRTTLGEAKG
jgi:4-hydroxy-2-oxoheptanedioate aldolase